MVTKVVYAVGRWSGGAPFPSPPTSAMLGVVVGIDASKWAALKESFNQA